MDALLSGSLDAFALPDVLRFACSQAAPGRLDVVRADVRGTVVLAGGRVVDVSVDGEQARGEGDRLDGVLRLLDGVGGEFSLRRVSSAPGTLSLSVEELLGSVERRREAWDAMTAAIGSLDASFRLDPAAADRGESVSFGPDEWRVVALLGSGRSARQISADAGISQFSAASMLADLVRRGLVTQGAAVVSLDRPASAGVIRVGAPAPVAATEPDDVEVEDPGDEPVDAAEILRELGLDEEEPAPPPPAAQKRAAAASRDRRIPYRR